MHYLNSTISVFKKTTLFIFITFSYFFASAQENSPYTRFGIGDVMPSQNIASRGMGGISAGYIDGNAAFQSINLNNPASLPFINRTIFDLGAEVDVRNLKSNNSPEKYKSVNTNISYLQLAFPLTTDKMRKSGFTWVMAMGLRPLTRINYKLESASRVAGIDSINTLYEGSGGVSQANISTGIKIKNFSFGISSGYSFGNRNISTQKRFVNDSVDVYKFSNTASDSRFGGIFLNLGAQYSIPINKKTLLRIGATANLQQNLKATRNEINETIVYDPNGTAFAIDTVSINREQTGFVKLPSSYSLGFTVNSDHWIIGADVDIANWSTYRFYGVKDPLQNSYKIRVGAQYFPADENTLASKKLLFLKYRAGFYYGSDYVNLNSNRPDYGVTFGAGIPLTSSLLYRRGEFVSLNTGIEIGQRGNKSNLSIREGIFRISIGLSMSATWFQKRKYD
jgi:hypothetical protein